MDSNLRSQAIDRLSPMIGKIALIFADAEYALDECVLDIYSKHDRARGFEKEFPRMLSRKITFLRRCFNQIEALSVDKEDKEDSLKILQQMVELADHRNFLVHGSPAPECPSEFQLVLRRISYAENAPYCEERTYSYGELFRILDRCAIVCVNALFLAHFLKTDWTSRLAKSA